eukprot:TRINITY_DN6752_c0_g1_i4.p1 TRINITY_DN6752_c0_g1~~TRINITY_DN6752_c0_g1_i4.p1  ORF type:complete len:340 (-),score=59.93 TRINITY_DN6752_c0_g1_i4:139-1158(-)
MLVSQFSSFRLRRAINVLVAASVCLWMLSSISRLANHSLDVAFTGNSQAAPGRLHTGSVALNAYTAIQRRDKVTEANMNKYIKQMLKVRKRELSSASTGEAWSASDEKKAAYLKRLGLGNKIKQKDPKPWHFEHIAAGDTFEGNFEHPGLNSGTRVDLVLEVTSPTEGVLSSQRGGFESDVKIEQDFSIAYEKGEQRDQDITAYVFQKYNRQWRDFSSPLPTDEEMQYLSHGGLQLFFFQAAEVEYFPPEEDFRKACADPEKGMTRAEFLAYIRAEDPDYLDKTLKAIFTGRRLRLSSTDFDLQGDFQDIYFGMMVGYAKFEGKPGGLWSLDLVKNPGR